MESYQHNQVKLAVAAAVQAHVQRPMTRMFFTDGMQLRLPNQARSINPDGFLLQYRSARKSWGFCRSQRGRIYAVEGVPALIVEVASPTRLEEDYYDKLSLYRKAHVKEFWLFRPAGPSYEFDLLTIDRHGDYYRQRPYGKGGWSKVLQRFCWLDCLPSAMPGVPRYELRLSAAGCRQSAGRKLGPSCRKLMAEGR